MITNQELPRYGTAKKLGLIPTKYGTRSYVLISSFKANECGNCKLENKHHSGAYYFSLPDLMGNDSYHP